MSDPEDKSTQRLVNAIFFILTTGAGVYFLFLANLFLNCG